MLHAVPVFVMSAVNVWVLAQLSAANATASLFAAASPVWMLEFDEPFVASIDVRPADTLPMTWPPTPSPVEAAADCVAVSLSFPCWIEHGPEPMFVMSDAPAV